MEKHDITIRRAKTVDAGQLADLGARTFWQAFGADNNPEDMQTYVAAHFSPAQIGQELDSTSATFFVAEVSDKQVGYAKLNQGATPDCVRSSRPIELERIYVDRAVLGTGIGAGLMQACLAEARARGFGTVWLGVWEKNHRALRFYRRWGFRKVGAHTFVLGKDVQQDQVMALVLD